LTIVVERLFAVICVAFVLDIPGGFANRLGHF
jgi:hypothetical protein